MSNREYFFIIINEISFPSFLYFNRYHKTNFLGIVLSCFEKSITDYVTSLSN